MGHKDSEDEELKNIYGGHKTKFKSSTKAFDELVIKPNAFNAALKLLDKAGYDVVKKGIISRNGKVLSYQMENIGAWKD